MEWLASYYTHRTDEHADEELERYAPLGTAELYYKIKDKLVTRARSVHLQEIEDWDDD